MAVKRDYYEVLGVDRSVGADELKRTFRKLALEYHPDRNPDKPEAADRFKEISEAYAVLSDPEKRRRYDLFGHGGVGAEDAGFENFGFGDIFDSIFGGVGARPTGRRSNRGDDLRCDLTIEFEEAFKGLERNIDVPRLVRCETCSGSGAKAGTRPEICTTCGGAGQVRRQAQSIFGMVVNIVPCPECGGEGRVLRSPCPDCKGQGRVREDRKVPVRIPAGVEDGTQFRHVGEGEAGLRGGPAGDLYVVVRVKPHALFVRRGRDVIHTLAINIVQAALGDTLEIPTLDGPVTFHIPDGTQFGQQFRLAGKGMPDMRTGRRGDQVVVARVVVPKNLSDEQKNLLRKVGGLTGKPEKLAKGFFEKIRDAINID